MKRWGNRRGKGKKKKKSHGPCWTQASARESRSRLEQASDGGCHGGRGETGNGASLCLSGLASPWQEFWKTRHPESDTFPYIPLPPLPPATYVCGWWTDCRSFKTNNTRIWNLYLLTPEFLGLEYTYKSNLLSKLDAVDLFQVMPKTYLEFFWYLALESLAYSCQYPGWRRHLV